MTSWGHLAAGAIALALAQPLLKALQSNGSGASQLAKLANVPATLVSKFMDPTVPAFSSSAQTTAAAGVAAGNAGAAAKSAIGSVAFGNQPGAPAPVVQPPVVQPL